MSAEDQIATLVDLGYTLPAATATVHQALALVPEGNDPATWVPTAEQLDDGVGDADVVTARNDWYATAPDLYARLLDATEMENTQ